MNSIKEYSATTAVLIFAQTPETESQSKPFLKSAQLFSELNKQTLFKVKKSGLPFFYISEREQIGNTFGERYVNAIQFVYDQGYDNIITIGNDTPTLKTHHLLDSVKKLQKNNIVLGPSFDGGYYLLGLHKSHFNKELFLQLPWQTSRLLEKIKQLFLSNSAKVSIISRLRDIDTFKDVKKLAGSFKTLGYSILRILLSIISTELFLNTINVLFISLFQRDIHHNKGSPIYL